MFLEGSFIFLGSSGLSRGHWMTRSRTSQGGNNLPYCLTYHDFQQPNEDPSTMIHSSMGRRTSTGEFIVTTADMVMASNEHHLKIQRITLIILPLLLFSIPCTLPFFSASFISTDMETKRLSKEFGSSLTWYISDKLLNI